MTETTYAIVHLQGNYALTYDENVIRAAKEDPTALLKSRDELAKELEFWRERCMSMERIARPLQEFLNQTNRVR